MRVDLIKVADVLDKLAEHYEQLEVASKTAERNTRLETLAQFKDKYANEIWTWRL